MPKNPDNIDLSILILSIPSRFDKLNNLLQILDSQITNDRVEVLTLVDNKSFHIYEKRNELLDMSRGKYTCFLDDDDSVSDDYVPTILNSIDNNPTDVICFKQHCDYNGHHFDVYFDINHRCDPMDPLVRNGNGYNDIMRPPFHMCPFSSKISKSEKFREKYSSGGQSCEDADWLLRLYPKVKSQTILNKALHYYHYNSQTTESIVR